MTRKIHFVLELTSIRTLSQPFNVCKVIWMKNILVYQIVQLASFLLYKNMFKEFLDIINFLCYNLIVILLKKYQGGIR